MTAVSLPQSPCPRTHTPEPVPRSLYPKAHTLSCSLNSHHWLSLQHPTTQAGASRVRGGPGVQLTGLVFTYCTRSGFSATLTRHGGIHVWGASTLEVEAGGLIVHSQDCQHRDLDASSSCIRDPVCKILKSKKQRKPPFYLGRVESVCGKRSVTLSK